MSAVFSPPRTAPAASGTLLGTLIDLGVILAEEWDELPADVRADLGRQTDPEALRAELMRCMLITRYQADMIRRGAAAELMLGHYRLLEPLGRGGMGVVYRAEHVHLRRLVAIKVMAERHTGDQRLMDRFLMEARAVARLQHPNIVTCLDAGREESPAGYGAAREYFVMDLVPGSDLFETVTAGGPMPVARAAGLFRQVADALAEAHRIGLVHRDIKPTNILVTPDWRAMLLDFGLARHPARQITTPGALLGTIGYIAPEQARDPSRVDGRADVFGLGASLFLALTGVEPYRANGAPLAIQLHHMTGRPPRIRDHRPDLPADLDALVAKLMDPDPERRFPSAAATASALQPYTRWRPVDHGGTLVDAAPRPRVLVIDDDPDVRVHLVGLLHPGFECVEAADGREGLAIAEAERFDLVVVDHEMPRMDGARVIAQVARVAPAPRPMILYMSGRAPTEALGGLLTAGADDFIRKPFQAEEFLSRVRGLLGRRAGRTSDHPLPPEPPPAHTDVTDPADLFAAGACRLLEEAGRVSAGYMDRIAQYVRLIARSGSWTGNHAPLDDPAFVDRLARVGAAHDIGLLAVPGSVLGKPGRLDPDERMAVEEHAVVGGRLYADLLTNTPGSPGLALAAEAALSHHERWDGGGYPHGLAGDTIPLAGRVIGLVSAYDAIRSRRPHRPAFSHPRAVRLITAEAPGQFDPALVAAFAAAADQFDRVAQSAPR